MMFLSISSLKSRLNRNGSAHGNGGGQSGRYAVPMALPPADVYERLRHPRSLTYPETTIGQLLDQSAARFPTAPAVEYGDLHWSYRELLERVNRLAGGLADMGVSKGDRVLMTLPNCPEFVVSFLAIQKLGAVVVNAGPLMGVDDVHEMVRMTNPCVVIALDLHAAKLTTAMKDSKNIHWLWVSLEDYQPVITRLGYRLKRWTARPTGDKPELHKTWKQLREEAPCRPPTVAPNPDDIALLQPTGGTTGTLKVAELTHRNLLANAMQLSMWVKLLPGQEKLLAILPMFHVYGLMLGLIVPLFSVASILPLTRFKLDQLIDVILRHRPTMIPLVPAIFEIIADALQREPRPELCEVLRHAIVMSGAAPLSETTSERFKQLTGVSIVQGYGLTEASPVTHANPYDMPRNGSIGVSLPDTFTRIAALDDPSKPLPTGEPGELMISGPQVFRGYLGNPEETNKALYQDETGRTWLRTGDIAQIDDQGFVSIVDRRKHMINRSGLKVYPRRVEKVLKLHPKVLDVAVAGRPNPKTTEDVVAYIVTDKHGAEWSKLTEELTALCREHLAPYEVPSDFVKTDELPRSALGKLLKHKLDKGAQAAPVEVKPKIAEPVKTTATKETQ